ncbi:MAG: hypothetical protein ACM3IJ_03685, partial [Candidatus Levyibacteriota bacterium]
MKNKWTTGGIEIFLLIIIFAAAFFLVGGFGKILKSDPGKLTSSSSLMCCDTGNGDACKPQDDKKIAWKGTNAQPEDYGLLKTGITFTEGMYHLKDSGDKTPNGDPIIINTTDTYGGTVGECGNGHDDQIYGNTTACFAYPNDELIYVCTKDCDTSSSQYACGGIVSCYGNPKSVFDVYFRLKDYPNPGVPDPIKNCDQNPLSSNPAAGAGGGMQAIIAPTTNPNQDLQLQTFKIVDVSQSSPWVSPYCKPAVYLYPEIRENVSVQVDPAGHFTYTDPLYPSGGWQVTADPSGTITSGSKDYSYLYYEADIPSLLIPKPTQGFVTESGKIESKLDDILSKLGLIQKEKTEMISYWQKALPKSPYYFIGVIPQNTLESIAPFTINPTPNTVIR